MKFLFEYLFESSYYDDLDRFAKIVFFISMLGLLAVFICIVAAIIVGLNGILSYVQ